MAKWWLFYEAFKFTTSLKTHNGEGGQNGEVLMVPIYLKGIFILETFILYNFGPIIWLNPFPLVLEYLTFFPFKS